MESHTGLYALRLKLKDIVESIASFQPVTAKPPIIDASADADQDVPRQGSIDGLRMLRDAVQRDLDVLEKFLAVSANAHGPALSTNAPYLIAVWNEVVHAPRHVTAVWSTFSEAGTLVRPQRRGVPKDVGVKVDVVADGGRQWIRVNTTKNSRLLAEFREIDSYLTDSEDDADASASAERLPALDNTVIRMAKSLLAAARANPIAPTSEIPLVTMRLTRLSPSPDDDGEFDPRIPQTIDKLRKMGIDVQLGERDEASSPEHPFTSSATSSATSSRTVVPSSNVNLDLSILVALISDLTHASLPSDVEDAERRFTPSAQYLAWKKRRDDLKRGVLAGEHNEDDDAVARPSRALVQQVLQETSHALLQDMHERIQHRPHTKFWTTPEARERCLQIVAKIGGPLEKARAHLLLTPQVDVGRATAEFWRHSRYPSGYVPLIPIQIFPAASLGECSQPLSTSPDLSRLPPFFKALDATCRAILAQDTMPDPRTLDGGDDDDDSSEIQRATVMKANSRLTEHTVQSMLCGAASGWTTLTANKSSVKIILREMKTGLGGTSSDGDVDGAAEEIAALWIVEPRSLAEGMRADVDAVIGS